MLQTLHRKWLAAVALMLSALVTISWAYTTGFANLQVHAVPVSNLPGGFLAQVVPTPQSLVAYTDRPSQSGGMELYRIQLGSPTLSNHIHVHFYWTNPLDTAAVLHKGWVQVGVYYPDANGNYTLLDGTTKVSLDSSTLWAVNPQSADAVLTPQVQNQSTLYVIATIVNSAGNIPSGQQAQWQLKFFCQVSK